MKRRIVLGVSSAPLAERLLWESPFSKIHLYNMAYLSALPNVFLQSPVLSYYHHPEKLEDMDKQIVEKTLSRFEIDTGSYRSWN